jgi:hypothetical protein
MLEFQSAEQFFNRDTVEHKGLRMGQVDKISSRALAANAH